MGGRGSLAYAMFALLTVRTSHGQPVADTAPEPEADGEGEAEAEAEAASSTGIRATLVGTRPLDTPESTFATTAAGLVQLTGDEDSFADVVLVGGAESYYCTGVLIDPRHVLTAGHCAAATRVAFGNRLPAVTAIAVRNHRQHPQLDVALLALDRPATVRAHTRRRVRDTTPTMGALRILGFGVRDRLRLTGFGTKRQLDVDVDGWGCTTARASTLGCSPADELVVRGGSGNDTCLGDSGGPVFELVDGNWRLVAITSRGMRPRKVICGEGGIYVRVDRIDAWIEKERTK